MYVRVDFLFWNSYHALKANAEFLNDNTVDAQKFCSQSKIHIPECQYFIGLNYG